MDVEVPGHVTSLGPSAAPALAVPRTARTGTAGARPRLVGPDGQSVELPESIFDVLLQVAAAMKAGLAVTVAPHHLTLSTQEAADLLRNSRTTLVRLLEAGVIPFDKPSRLRKVRLDDLLEYRRRQRRQAELALADMVADTERLGLHHTVQVEVRESPLRDVCDRQLIWTGGGATTTSLVGS
jgi:excisionase family DNA binding protein